MFQRESGGRRPVLFTLLFAASLTLPVLASVHSRRSAARGETAGVATADSPGVKRPADSSPSAAAPAAPLPPGSASVRVAPTPTAAATIKPALICESSCDDGDPCTVDRCDQATGQCVHPPVVCDDFSPCTVDSCEPGLGCRFAPVTDGIECGTNPCMSPSVCQAGECVQGHSLCDDGNDCTNDSCDSNGECEHFLYNCDDGNGCTLDSCDPAGGACHHTLLPQGAACDDQNPCTTATACRDIGMGGVQCVGTNTPGAACNDQNPCSVNDVCLDSGGYAYCQGTYKDCNDSDECTQDYCDGNTGQCQHLPASCDDRNPCTIDSCDPATGCHNTQLDVGSLCDDLNGCTADDQCRFGNNGFNCYGTATPGAACDDGNACSIGDVCYSQPFGGYTYCLGTPLECGDGNACTNDGCNYQTGECVSFPVGCNDGNTCTDDSCSIQTGCQHAPHPEGSVCDDFNACSAGDVCQAGRCVGPQPVTCDDQRACTLDYCNPKGAAVSCLHVTTDCDDGNPCTDDSCREPDGTCVFTPHADGTECSDQSACTVGETCQGGQCTGTALPPCDDGNPCTTDVCDPATGACLSIPISCNDGDNCTIDSCDPLTGECRHDANTCDDGNVCTGDVCDPGTGQCQHPAANEGSPCDDGDACTEETVCQSGLCAGGAGVVCDDGQPCTNDACDPAIGCIFTPKPDGAFCTDKNECTTQDHCVAGQCAGTPKVCNDGNACTLDECDPVFGQCGFKPQPDGTACDDGNACTPGDQCLHSQCVGGPPPVCADGDACTRDSCDPSTGSCRFLPVTCDDANPCTLDSCDPASGCRYAAAPNGTACDDGTACVTVESCQYGQCVGVTKSCDDGQACTYDYCDGHTGACFHSSSCDDGNACTDDVCLPGGGCDHLVRAVGASCDDGNPCSADDACVDLGVGVPICQGTATPGASCDDQNPCTHDDTCLDSGGSQAYCQGTPVDCSDGEMCNADYCDGNTGQCVHQPLNCNDNNPCTTDRCGPAEGQCTHDSLPSGAACNDPCVVGGTCSPGPKGPTCSGASNVGASCDDHNSCSENDRCRSDGRGGTFCGGTGISCEDGLGCTGDYCDPSIGQCRQQPISCEDGDACTLNACSEENGGMCTSTPAPLYEVVTISAGTTNGTFHWTATPASLHWNSYRGSIPGGYLGSRLPGSVYDHVCLESADAASDGALESSDAENPPPGTAYYYDATGESGCGEGPLGKDSAGNVRPNPAPCPTPP